MIVTESGRKLYNYEEAGELLGICASTVRKYARILELSLYPCNRMIHLDESQLLQIAEARKNIPRVKPWDNKKKASK
jgi:hypothetical protein